MSDKVDEPNDGLFRDAWGVWVPNKWIALRAFKEDADLIDQGYGSGARVVHLVEAIAAAPQPTEPSIGIAEVVAIVEAAYTDTFDTAQRWGENDRDIARGAVTLMRYYAMSALTERAGKGAGHD